jgi:hypothetical protein
MPLADMRLVIEPTYPRARALMELGKKVEEDAEFNGAKVRNIFWSWRWRAKIAIWELNGKIEWGPVSSVNQSGMLMETISASDAWGIEQEAAALQTLARLLSHRQMKQYLLTGMFVETSKRSGVVYMFRKLRPTLAVRTHDKGSRILAALCMHPIGYYQGTWAGAMCPTDDVIAHLMLMRGDEHMLWRRCHQHPAYEAAAGP